MNDSRAQVQHPWSLLVFLAIATAMNFFLRVNLAVAAPLLGPEMKLSPQTLGLLLSSFYWTYAACQIWAGWMVDQLDVRWIYAAALATWSLTTLLIGVTTSFSTIFLLVLLLGFGESVAYPANSRVVTMVFPEARRGLANSIIDLGARLGPAVGTMCGGLLVAGLGWRHLFLVTGGIGLFLLVPWLILAPRRTSSSEDKQEPTIGWGDLLRMRPVWGTCFGQCGANYAWYFLLSWLPTYLVRERHFTLTAMAVWGATPYLLMAISSVSGGVLADRLIARGGSPVRVRKMFLVVGLVVTGLLLPLVLIPDVKWALAGLLAACFGFGIYASNLWSLTQSLAGVAASGRWTGFQNACGNIAGIAAPVVTGWILQRTNHFALAFIGASFACLFGAASFSLLVRSSDVNCGVRQKTAIAMP